MAVERLVVLRCGRRTFLRLSALGAASGVFLAACAGAASAPTRSGSATAKPDAGAKPSGAQVWGLPGLPGSLDPFVNVGLSGQRRAAFVTVVEPGPNGTFLPLLFSSWKAEGTNWTFKVREDAKFSDGSPVNAEDVVFSYQTQGDPANKYVVGELPAITQSVRAADAKTLIWETKQPNATLLGKMASNFPIVSAKGWGRLGAAGYAANPVSVGPYRYVSAVPNQTLVLESDPNFWSPGKLASLTFQALPDEAARLAALRSGAIQVATALTSDSAVTARAAGKIVQAFSAAQFANLIVGYSAQRSPAALKDVRVRQAIAHAVDWPAVAKLVGGEWANPLYQLSTKEDIGFNPAIRPYPHDPALAKQLLQQAGAQGLKLTLDAQSTSSPMVGKLPAQAIVDALTLVGLEITVGYTDTPTHLRNMLGVLGAPLKLTISNNRSRDFSANLGPWIGLAAGQSKDNAWYASPRLWELLEKSDAELDAAKRTTLLHQEQQIIHDDLAFNTFAEIMELCGTDSSVKGVRFFDGFPDFISLSN